MAGIGIKLGGRSTHEVTSGKGPSKRVVVSKTPPLTERASSMPSMTEDKISRPPHEGGIKGGKTCTLCGGRGHAAKSHVSGDSASGPAITQNKAAQFDTSKSWAGGGEGNSQQQGSCNYKSPGGDGGMS